MTDNKDLNFVKEIMFCINEEDVVKAKALVQYFSEINSKIQMRVLYELSKSPDQVAFPVLDYLCRVKSEHDEVNNKIYDLILEIAYDNAKLVSEYIEKKNTETILTYIKIAGDLKLEGTADAIINALRSNPEMKVIEACISSLGSIGSEKCVAALTAFLSSGDVMLKTCGIAALSEIGSDAAIENLSGAVTGDNKTDQFILEGLASVQNQQSMDKLSGMLASPFANIRSMAIDNLTKIGPKAVPSLIEQVKNSDDKDLQIHSLTILGQIGDETAIPAIQGLLHEGPDDSNVRYGAYEALGRLPSTKTSISLAVGLEDPDEQVRMAAAKAIDKNLSNILKAGLKNMIKAGDEQAKEIVATLINSESDKIFDDLIEWEEFENMATDYLVEKAPPDIREHYQIILQGKGKNDLAEKLQNAGAQVEPSEDKLQIFAVDDSKMMLKLYTKKLHDMGHNPVTFEFPAEALSEIKKSKPDLVVTDLNMPTINGLQLTKEIRGKYKSKELPVIMITTQSDFVGKSSEKTSSRVDEESIMATGVDKVLHKPFKDEELASAIIELTGKK